MNLNFNPIPVSDPDIVSPGRGAELWNYMDQAIDYPSEGQGFAPLDFYFRFKWTDFEDVTAGAYNWNRFDSMIQQAISNRQKFGFGIMAVADAVRAYPNYLHNLMMNEAVKPLFTDGKWFPNWDSEHYITRLIALNRAINAHIETGSYQGVRYKDVINYIDVRGYGDWGEWHSPGIFASANTLKRIISAHVDEFPNHQLVVIISVFDGDRLQNTRIPAEVGYHALTVKNNVGLLGWRRDNWAAPDPYIRMWTDQNEISYQGLVFGPEIMNRWMHAPINGEPMNGGTDVGGNCHYWDFENQVRRYRAVMVGNGNYVNHTSSECARTNVRNAFKAMGYRLVLNGGSKTSAVSALDRRMTIKLNWRNIGLTPTYEKWNVNFKLKNSAGNVIWSGKSAHEMRLFLPQSSDTIVTDTFTLPSGLQSGTHQLILSIEDPNGYRAPLPLAIQGRASDGSYSLGTVQVP